MQASCVGDGLSFPTSGATARCAAPLGEMGTPLHQIVSLHGGPAAVEADHRPLQQIVIIISGPSAVIVTATRSFRRLKRIVSIMIVGRWSASCLPLERIVGHYGDHDSDESAKRLEVPFAQFEALPVEELKCRLKYRLQLVCQCKPFFRQRALSD
jgi:hypothetical protein